MKDRKCKCSHLKSQHGKWYHTCQECACSDFMRYDKPNLSTKIGMGIGIVWLGLIIFVIVGLTWAINDMEQMNPEAFGESVDMTIGDFLNIMIIILFGLMILLWLLIGLDGITDYFAEKKRKDWN